MKKLRKSLFLLLISSGSLLLTSCGLTTSRIELQNKKDENANTQSQENNFIQKETLTTEKTDDLLNNSEAQISQKNNFEQKSNPVSIPKSNIKTKTVKKQILKNFSQNKPQQQQQKQLLSPKNNNKTEIITKKQPEVAVFANFSQKYSQLENDVKNFINTELKELKHEFFRDKLNQVIDEVEYEKIRDQKNQNDSFFKNNIEKLTKIFDEVKTDYKNSTDFSQIIQPKIQDEKPKEKDENSYPLGIEKYQDYQGNLNSNNSAKSFMNLIDPKDVRNLNIKAIMKKIAKKLLILLKN